MTGEELQRLMNSANMSDLELARLLDWKGPNNTVRRAIRRMKQQNEILPEVAAEVLKLTQKSRYARRRMR